ncbi:MAG: hypothetical protein ACREA4_07825 [Nitrososphaera sp.]
MPRGDPRSQDGSGKPTPPLRRQVLVLAAVLAILATAIAMSPGDLMGFFQGISEERNLVSIGILATFIGVLFVLLQRVGLVFSYEDDIGPPQSNSA